MIIDSSVVLSAFFPDEAQAQAQTLIREHVAGRGSLKAPDLLPYELANAVWQAERRGRIQREQADQVLESMRNLEIALFPLAWAAMLPLARQFERSAYDAAYLTPVSYTHLTLPTILRV